MGMLQVSQLLAAEKERGNVSERQFAKIVGGFRGTYTWTHFDKLHLVLDTIDGTLADKQAFFREMEKHVTPGTTVVPVSPRHRVEDLQQGLEHPERVVGLHLIEPWNRGSLAEIVATPATAQPHLQRIREWAIGLGKCCLQVPDRIGGLTMRVWLPALNEAGLMVKEGVPIDRIDKAMRRFGMSYGPCEWMDRLGIDQIASLAAALQPTFAGRITFESGFARMVEKQWLGNLTGLGFYLRSDKPQPHRAAAQLWQTDSKGETAQPTPALSEADAHAWIQNRLVTLTMLEAVRCLDEDLAKDADDLDCALCLSGWATHRGGPLGHALQLGAEAVTARCNDLAAVYGPRFAPFAALTEFLSD
jgi:3-hydroxyacyl-CoA dehydrogenase/enoyl-CoA hydratase/3-hydroxybutyryl-CoA epimerase